MRSPPVPSKRKQDASDARQSETASPSSAEASSSLGLGVRMQFLCDRTPSPALAECLPGVCPWCVVKARHGDFRHAVATIQQRRALLPSQGSSGRFILQHCQNWLTELAEADAAGELRMVHPGDVPHTVPPPAFTIAPGLPRSSASASSSVPACPAGPSGHWRPWSSQPSTSAWLETALVPSQLAHATGDSSRIPPPPPGISSVLPPPPPPPSHQPADFVTWEVWGGKRTKWIPYSMPICLALSRMEVEGPAQADFTHNGTRYTINVQTMEQNNPATEHGPRMIRKRPTEEAD